jgi:hypothetical protein
MVQRKNVVIARLRASFTLSGEIAAALRERVA